jgi:hypothetical protein
MNAQLPLAPAPQHKMLFGIRAVALLELGLFLLVALVIDALFGNGNRFWNVEPHPFWIIIILLSVQYGVAAGLIAVLASTLALLLFNLPDQRVDQDTYSWLYEVALNPLMWLVAAALIGELRMRHIRERDELHEQVDEIAERERAITESYDTVRQFKENLELRIAGQMRAATETYRAAQALEKLHPNDVMHGIEDLMRSALSPKKCSIFLLENNLLEERLVSGWDDRESFARSFDPSHRLFQRVIGGQETLSIINAEHQVVMGDQGVLTTPIIDKNSGQVLGMLKIEQMPFTELNLQTIETFRAIGEWAGMAVLNAMQYQEALQSSVINPQSKLMTPGYFNRFSDYITALAKRQSFNVTMLEVSLNNADALDHETRLLGGRLLAEAVERALRTVDLAFENHLSGASYSIILPTANSEGARVVQTKIEDALLPEVRHKARGLSYSFRIQPLHESA